LELNKNVNATGFYNDALVYQWDAGIRPKHLHFEVWTDDSAIETCDLQLYTLDPDPKNINVQDDCDHQYRFLGPPGPNGFRARQNSQILFFRIGYHNHVKLNIESMIKPTVTGYWMVVDLLIDWDT
jgi:hypothetical protein